VGLLALVLVAVMAIGGIVRVGIVDVIGDVLSVILTQLDSDVFID
jgi:hypothetical protein